MELDKLKNIWQNESFLQQKQDEDLKLLLGKRSNSPVAKMKKNLFMELIIVVITYSILIVYYLFAFSGKVWEMSWFLLIIALVFIVYYYRKNKLLSEMQCLSCQVKSNLERQVRTLEKYIRFYLIAGTLLVPLAFLFFAGLLYYKFPTPADPGIFYVSPGNPIWMVLLAWIVVTTVFTVLIYYLNKWYAQKLYGKHIQKLKETLREMEDD